MNRNYLVQLYDFKVGLIATCGIALVCTENMTKHKQNWNNAYIIHTV
jgi:hypothetical protein